MTSRYKFYAFLTAVIALSGCSLDEPTKITQNRVQVQQEKFIEELPVETVDAEMVAAMGSHYYKHGAGPVDLSVVYDPKSSTNTAMKANNELVRISNLLRKNGIKNVRANILPVQGNQASVAVISYTSYTTQPPKDCGVLAGVENTNIEVDADYKLGCTIETVYSKQIARPKDLAGHSQEDETTDGRRGSNIVEIHRTGQPNEPLGGESASGD